MSLEKPTITNTILDALYLAGEFLPRPFETKYSWARRLRHIDPDKYRRAAGDLAKRGLVTISQKNNKKFIQLTQQGELHTLLQKRRVVKLGSWDRKWRVIIFDIPELSNHERRVFRNLLKRNNFHMLQASVYISPQALNREAITYLRKSGLIQFIRIFRVDEMDDDKELRKKFKL